MKIYSGGPEWQITPTVHRAIRSLRKDYRFSIVDSWPLDVIGEFCIVIAASPATINLLRSDGRVASIQQVKDYRVMRSLPPYNDDQLALQLGQDVDAMSRLHRWSTGEDVRVGIIDTSVDGIHPDLLDAVISQENFTGDSPGIEDMLHGTAVAGIIAARPNNLVGVVGFAPDVSLHTYAACYHDSATKETRCSSFAIAKALASAAADNLQVINLSIAGPPDPLLARLLKQISKNGTIVVASDNPTDPDARFPASLAEVIAATTSSALIPGFSIAVPDEHLTTRSGGEWQFFYGSSMSAARVSALVALILEKSPGMDSTAISSALENIRGQCLPDNISEQCLMRFALALSAREDD
jgi:hypothetical protein